eukprot:364743-Chlamydomonas_euryale.AAC.47
MQGNREASARHRPASHARPSASAVRSTPPCFLEKALNVRSVRAPGWSRAAVHGGPTASEGTRSMDRFMRSTSVVGCIKPSVAYAGRSNPPTMPALACLQMNF